jgi:hypothetical protein
LLRKFNSGNSFPGIEVSDPITICLEEKKLKMRNKIIILFKTANALIDIQIISIKGY